MSESAINIDSLAELFVQQWVDTLVDDVTVVSQNPDTTLDDITTAILDATSFTQNSILDMF